MICTKHSSLKQPNIGIINMEIKEKIKKNLLSKGTKLRNKYPPISQRSDNEVNIEKIKAVFQLSEDFNNSYLIITKPTNRHKEKNYYLAMVIASQSSDLLVRIAKNVMINEEKIHLIQFTFHPEHFRVSLALLRKLDEAMDFDEIKTKLFSLRTQFLAKLNNIID